MVSARKPKVFTQKNLLSKRCQMECAVREILASILSLSFFTRPVKVVHCSLLLVYILNEGIFIKMNDISA